MLDAIRKCFYILNMELTFHEFGLDFSFSIFDVIVACLILALFFRIFYSIYDR